MDFSSTGGGEGLGMRLDDINAVIPHPPMLGGVPPSSMRKAIGNCYCTFAHLCSTDLLEETAPVEGSWIIALFKSPITSHLLPTWEDGA